MLAPTVMPSNAPCSGNTADRFGTTVGSPLATGLLTGKYNDGVPDDARLGREGNAWLQRMVIGTAEEGRIERARRFAQVAQELGVAPATLAIAWCLRNPNVSTVMLGASKLSQLLQNFDALEVWQRFDDATWQRIETSLA